MDDPTATVEAEQGERDKSNTSTATHGLSKSAKLSKLRGKLFAKHTRPDPDDEALFPNPNAGEASGSSSLLSASRQFRNQEDELNDFLHGGPAIPAPITGPRRNLSLLAPRLNLAAARDATNASTPEERWIPTKPRRREGLKVAFNTSHIYVIGFGGDQASAPVNEVGRRNAAASSSDGLSRRPDRSTNFDSSFEESIPKDASAQLSMVHGPSQGPHEPLSRLPQGSASAPRFRNNHTTGVGSNDRGLRRLHAEEGRAFRAAVGVPLDDEDQSRPATSGSFGSRKDGPSQTIVETAARENHTLESGASSTFSSQLPFPLAEHTAMQAAARNATHVLLQPSQQHGLETNETAVEHLQYGSPYSAMETAGPAPATTFNAPRVFQHGPHRHDDMQGHATRSEVPPHQPYSIAEFPTMVKFGARVAHLGTIFSAAASTSNRTQEPLSWARAATWWFLRARGGLEELVRSPVPIQDSTGLNLLHAHLVNLAKVWWIVVTVIPSLPSSTDSIVVDKARHNLTASFEALSRSMEKRSLLPAENLELISGLDTSIWASNPHTKDIREAQALRYWAPVASLERSTTGEVNAYANLALAEPLHRFIYLRAFAPAVLNSLGETKPPPDVFPIMLTLVRSTDSYRPILLVTTQSGFVDLTATLIPASQVPGQLSRSDPARILPAAALDPESGSISLALPRHAADSNTSRVVQIRPRPVDFSKATALVHTCITALTNSTPLRHERELMRVPLSQCQMRRDAPKSTPWSVQSSILFLFSPHPEHSNDDAAATTDDDEQDSFGSSGADAHKSQRRLAASLLSKGLATLRVRSRLHGESASGKQRRSSSSSDEDGVEDAVSDHDDGLGSVHGASGAGPRSVRLGVVTEIQGRKIDSAGLSIGGAGGWEVAKMDVDSRSEEPGSIEQTYGLRVVLVGPTARAGDMNTTREKQEWVFVFTDRQHRYRVVRLLQSLHGNE